MECFTVYANEIEGRIDPPFYRQVFRLLEKKISKLNHKNLGSVIGFSNETWNQTDFFENEFPYIEISEIDITSGDIQNITYYEKTKAPSRAKMIVRENDIIVSTTRPHRGAITLIDKDKEGFIASTGFAILREPKIEINKKYLLFFLRTQLTLKQMLQRSSGGNYPAITSEELKKVIVLLPPPKTQNSIVQLMDNAYEIKKQKETEAQQLIDSINDYVLSELGIKLPELKDKICFVVWSDEIEERIDPFYYRYDFVKIDKNIKSLNHKRIRDLSLDLKNGSTPAGGVFEKEGVPYFRSQDFNLFDFKINQFITPDFHKQLMRSAIRSGDVLVAVVGATLGVIGYVPKEIKEGNINQNVARVRVIDKNINPKYLAILLASDLGQKQIFRNATVTTQAYLNNQQLGEIKIPLPPLQIQNNIANEVKARMQKAEQLQKEAKTVLEEAKERVERVILGEEEI